jgi:predicted DNA-binding transcriptional regulator AlpA
MSGPPDGRPRFIQPEEIARFLDEPGPSLGETAVEESPVPRNRSGRIAKLHDAGREAGSLGIQSKKRLIISRDAAAFIGLAPQTLAKLRVTGGSPQYFKIGRQVLYDQADLDSWLSVRRRRSTSDAASLE